MRFPETDTDEDPTLQKGHLKHMCPPRNRRAGAQDNHKEKNWIGESQTVPTEKFKHCRQIISWKLTEMGKTKQIKSLIICVCWRKKKHIEVEERKGGKNADKESKNGIRVQILK